MVESNALIPQNILEEFQNHCNALCKCYKARKESVVLRNVVEDNQEHEAVSKEETLGKKQPGDVFEGDVNLRTLRTLLKMIDEQGWERYEIYVQCNPVAYTHWSTELLRLTDLRTSSCFTLRLSVVLLA